jgi:hypothetical protein
MTRERPITCSSAWLMDLLSLVSFGPASLCIPIGFTLTHQITGPVSLRSSLTRTLGMFYDPSCLFYVILRGRPFVEARYRWIMDRHERAVERKLTFPLSFPILRPFLVLLLPVHRSIRTGYSSRSPTPSQHAPTSTECPHCYYQEGTKRKWSEPPLPALRNPYRHPEPQRSHC